jgi:hypothetical protein
MVAVAASQLCQSPRANRNKTTNSANYRDATYLRLPIVPNPPNPSHNLILGHVAQSRRASLPKRHPRLRSERGRRQSIDRKDGEMKRILAVRHVSIATVTFASEPHGISPFLDVIGDSPSKAPCMILWHALGPTKKRSHGKVKRCFRGSAELSNYVRQAESCPASLVVRERAAFEQRNSLETE